MDEDIGREELLRRVLEIKKASTSFLNFVRYMHPEWVIPEFHLELIETLDKLERRALVNARDEPVYNLLVNLPPRHAKSEICTKLFPTYYMLRKPSRHVISASYNSILARDFGRAVRNMARGPEVKRAFPRFEMSSKSVDAWTTPEGGSYYSVGMGATTSGRPATLLVVDDPLRNRKDSDSKIKRDDVWNYYTSALDSRLQPEIDGSHPIQIIVLTRWHTDDLAGRLMQTDGWMNGEWLHINKPSIIDEETKTVLWPDRFPYEVLAKKRATSPRDFESLHQQRPYTEGGEIIKRDWWGFYSPETRPEMETVVVVCDPANKATEINDYTVFSAWGVSADGDIYLLDLVREKFEFYELKQRLPLFSAQFRGEGLRAVYVEDIQTGTPLIQELKRETTLVVLPWRSFKDKVARAHMITPLLEARRVYLPTKGFTNNFIHECEVFPNGDHDDQVDNLTMALDVLSRVAVSGESKVLNGTDISLWRQYQDQREIVMGSAAKKRDKRSLRAMAGAGGWKGWGG